MDARRKVSLRCGDMLEDKNYFIFGGVITCRNTSYCGLLVRTMEEKCKIKDQSAMLLLKIIILSECTLHKSSHLINCALKCFDM